MTGELVDPRSEKPLGPGRFSDEFGRVRQFKVEDGQYAYPDREHFERGVAECDRAILVGHLELVPAQLVDAALARAPAHPWTVVHQSADKWRAAQDYSRYTNGRVGSIPFTLPSVWDAAKVVGPDSHFAKYDLRDGFWAIKTHPDSRAFLMVRHPATGRLCWCKSLPFGYKLSPLIFCDLTESVAQVFRSRVAGRGIHAYVFVDDFLIIGEDRAKTVEGMEILEALFNELGLQWAAHKRRGPARAIDFLGFLLVNEQGGQRVVAMSEGRHGKMSALVDQWLSRRPSDETDSWGLEEVAEPKELASLLGLLVFCASAVPNGRTHMQGMLRQFARLEVDWARGSVRWPGGEWGKVPLTRAFWRDLVWWKGAIDSNPSVPMGRVSAGVAAITGTDASDHACGELVWHDGGREEMQMIFTRAEKRRPINFRELLGTYRLVERWGARLEGRTLLIDIDNAATVGAASSAFSKAEDMQEIVRRLTALATEHNLLLRPVHTPGAMLDRPDQTSRGAAVEEPRVRMRRTFFRALEKAHGPFHELVGAEREFAERSGPVSSPKRLWAHPSFETVGTALGRICERMQMDAKECPRGLVVVPWAPEAAWWPLMRHMTCVARFGVGSRHLEENRAGRWVNVSSRRPSLVMAFPLNLGTVLPLDLVVPREASGERGRVLPGTLLYSPMHASTRQRGSFKRGRGRVVYALR